MLEEWRQNTTLACKTFQNSSNEQLKRDSSQTEGSDVYRPSQMTSESSYYYLQSQLSKINQLAKLAICDKTKGVSDSQSGIVEKAAKKSRTKTKQNSKIVLPSLISAANRSCYGKLCTESGLPLLKSHQEDPQLLSSLHKLGPLFLAEDKTEKKRVKVNLHPKRKPLYYQLSNQKGLPLNQRYFEHSPPTIQPKTLEKLGLYETVIIFLLQSNIYKQKNVAHRMNQLIVKANRYLPNLQTTNNPHQLFMTSFSPQQAAFLAEAPEFLINEVSMIVKPEELPPQQAKVHEETRWEQSERNSIQQDKLSYNFNNRKCQRQSQRNYQQTMYHLTIRNFEVSKDQFYLQFKKQNLHDWGSQAMVLDRIIKILKDRKISFFKVRTDRLAKLWFGKRLTDDQLGRFLNLKRIVRPIDTVYKICLGIQAKLRIRSIRNNTKRQACLKRWVTTRFTMLLRVKQYKKWKLDKARAMHNALMQHPQWQAQIYVPGFSMSDFQRNTTQYMESFESLFYHMWRGDNKTVIIVLPTINEAILKHFQARLPLRNNISIICPDTHELYPTNLSLAATLYFSNDALKRIKQILKDKKCVLIPGRSQHMTYELLLSQALNAPLLASLDVCNSHKSQKQFFDIPGVSTTPYYVIDKHSNMDNLIAKMISLISDHPKSKNLVFKLNNQFSGRGMAIFQIQNSKFIKWDNPNKDNNFKKHLQYSLTLKLKINNENTLFSIDKYLATLLLKGGIIEVYMDIENTYELCFCRTDVCHFLQGFQTYGIQFENKVAVCCDDLPSQVLTAVSLVKESLQNSKYFGYVSITLAIDADQQLKGIDIKPFQTQSSSAISLIRQIEQRRQLLMQCVNNAPTLVNQHVTDKVMSTTITKLNFSQYRYIFIPSILFTDVQETAKIRLIENIIAENWTDHNLDIHGQCKLFFSLGLSLSLLLMGKDLRRLKKQAVDIIRELADRSSALREYKGKQITRDVFHFGDIIRSLSKIRVTDKA